MKTRTYTPEQRERQNERSRQYNAKNKERLGEYRRNRYATTTKERELQKNKEWREGTGYKGDSSRYADYYKNNPKHRYNVYMSNATRRQLSFDLSFEEFMSYWQKPCFYCGAEISTIGLDRKDNSVGYEVSNIAPCCTTCNYLKRNLLNSEDFIDHCVKIADRASRGSN